MANFFDQFDAPAPTAQGGSSQPSGNFFDQFDAPAAPSPMGMGEAFLRGAEQGATLGFGDEARGILAASPMRDSMAGPTDDGIGGTLKRAAAWGVRNSPLALAAQGIEGAANYFSGDARAMEQYEQATGENRGSLAAAREQHPWTTTGGEIVGGVGATLPAMVAAPVAFGAGAGSMLTRMGAGLVSGAALGAVQGAGQTEGTIADRADGFGYGAAGGAVGGAAGAPLAAGVGALARQGMALLPQRAAGLGPAATREAVSALGEAGPQQVQARLAEIGPDGMLLDAAQPFLGRAQGLAAEPGAPGQRIVSTLRTRDASTDARLARGLDDAVGPAPVPSQLEAQFATRRREAGPMFEEALGSGGSVDTSAALVEIGQRLNTAAGAEQAALLRARDLLTQRGPKGLTAREDPRYLHNAKGALDDLIEYGDPTIGVARGALSRPDSALAIVRSRLNGALEQQVPGYADANLAYRTASRASEALDSGKRVLGGGDAAIHPADFAADFARRPMEQQAALRAGVRADLDRTVGNSANDLTALAGELKRPADWNRQKLAQTFGPEAVDAAARTVDANAAMRQSYRDVVQGSQTAQRTRGAAAMGVRDLAPEAGNAGVTAIAGAVGGPMAAAVPIAMKGGRFGLNVLGRASDRVRNEEFADLVTRQGPARDEAVARLIEALAGREGRQQAAGSGTAAVVQALIGSGGRESDVAARRRAVMARMLETASQ
jgi:hypothetical protein